jgi:hypothetical protein
MPAPMNGPLVQIQKSIHSHAATAGPNERAGFIDAPVIHRRRPRGRSLPRRWARSPRLEPRSFHDPSRSQGFET